MRALLLVIAMLMVSASLQVASSQTMYTCDDFDDPVAAQRFLDFDPVRYGDLDPDGDGIACESDEGGEPSSASQAAPTEVVTAPTAGTCDLQALTQADASVRTMLDGRLGGTLASFDAAFGPSTGSELFPEYTIPGCGPVLISDYEDSIVVTLNLFSPRGDATKDYKEPDGADWTISEAMVIAESFLPADAILDPPMGDMNPPAPGMLADEIEVRGWSQTLLDNVPAAAWDYVDNTPTYGGFSYWLLRTYSGDVSYIIIELEIED